MNNEQTPAQRRANRRLALVLGAIALMLALWPLYVLNKMSGGG